MDMTFLPFTFPGIPGVRCAFQTRVGGHGKGIYGKGNISFEVGDDANTVKQNRADLLKTLKLAKVAELKQVHGTEIIFEPDPGDFYSVAKSEGDGLATSRAGIGLAIKSADCQPILLAHESGEYIAALHVGWRGNELNFPGLAIEEICRKYQVTPEEMCAVRGPSLSSAYAEFLRFDQEWGKRYRPWFDERKKTMDLWDLTRHQLCAAGLSEERIFSLDFCSHTMDDLFFSYRRDKNTGRQMSIIWKS